MIARIPFALILCATMSSVTLADPRTLDVFTSFEPPDIGPLFGGATASAVFTGGSARTVGIPPLYHSGSFSWEVPAGVTTRIDFDTAAKTVELFALDTGVSDATIRAFDRQGVEVGFAQVGSSFSSPMGDFSNPITFTGPISQIQFLNPGGGTAWIDDFGFSVVPEPGSLTLLMAAAVVLMKWRNRY